MQWYVYIVECSDGTLYTGIATDVARRVALHNSGKGAKYTSTRLPVRILWQENVASRSEALKKEFAIKQLSRVQKQQLILGQ